jgi:hypothetical protein
MARVAAAPYSSDTRSLGSKKESIVKFRFQQLTKRGLWTSPGVFEDDLDGIVKSVGDGHVVGQPRAAVECDTGRVIFALDAYGQECVESAAIFGLAAARAA